MSEDAFIDHILSLKRQVASYGQEVDRLCGDIHKRDAEIARLRADRRERIATACLASLLSHDGWERISAPYLTQHAVGYADELINELDRKAKP